MRTYQADSNNTGIALLCEKVRYSEVSEECELQVIRPWNNSKTYPLVVFVQGCGWTHPNTARQLPQLCALSQQGFVCATIVHRNVHLGNAFPACLVDVKCAIRYLRAHAEEYCIDPERVCIWGTSSGGHIAQLTAFTGDFEKFKSSEYAQFSDAVKLAVSCCGPFNIRRLAADWETDENMKSLLTELKGDREIDQVLDEMSPGTYIHAGCNYPPVLILGGDCDTTVPFTHSEDLYNALTTVGSKAELVKVIGAEHGNNLWTETVVQGIFSFIKKNL